MSKTSFCIVMTTINDGHLMDGYWEQAKVEGVADCLKAFVIPDRRSPRELYEMCDRLRHEGFDISCPDCEAQVDYLNRFDGLSEDIPFNSDNRRNVGYLMALESGSDVIISLDDDNFVQHDEGVYDAYGLAAAEVTESQVRSENGWFNVLDLLACEPVNPAYARGFPYAKRHQQPAVTQTVETTTCRLNAGLWLGDPDIDGITWLASPVKTTAFKGQSVLLAQDTWTPINTQNTALHRDVMVAYYFVRMGYELSGLKIDRYGDIFSGYFAQACLKHFGHGIRFGTPVARHLRNSHHFMRDATAELACVWTLEDILEWLPGARLEGRTYDEAYLSLAASLDEQVEKFQGFIWTDATRGFFHDVTSIMRRWVAACRQIGVGSGE
jgi:hypothetical protein